MLALEMVSKLSEEMDVLPEKEERICGVYQISSPVSLGGIFGGPLEETEGDRQGRIKLLRLLRAVRKVLTLPKLWRPRLGDAEWREDVDSELVEI